MQKINHTLKINSCNPISSSIRYKESYHSIKVRKINTVFLSVLLFIHSFIHLFREFFVFLATKSELFYKLNEFPFKSILLNFSILFTKLLYFLEAIYSWKYTLHFFLLLITASMFVMSSQNEFNSDFLQIIPDIIVNVKSCHSTLLFYNWSICTIWVFPFTVNKKHKSYNKNQNYKHFRSALQIKLKKSRSMFIKFKSKNNKMTKFCIISLNIRANF